MGAVNESTVQRDPAWRRARPLLFAAALMLATNCGDDDPVLIGTATSGTGLPPATSVSATSVPATTVPQTTVPQTTAATTDVPVSTLPSPSTVPSSSTVPSPSTEPSPEVATVDEAIALVGDLMSQRVPDPELDVSPSVEQGALVDFGLWLALANADPISVQAGDDDGPWARATATVSSTTWDMGNGDDVTCDGSGVAITSGSPQFYSPDPGPCGYRYPTTSPYGEPFTLTVTASWAVTWTASDGRSGVSSALARTAGVPYRVVDWVVGPSD